MDLFTQNYSLLNHCGKMWTTSRPYCPNQQGIFSCLCSSNNTLQQLFTDKGLTHLSLIVPSNYFDLVCDKLLFPSINIREFTSGMQQLR